MYDIVSAVLFVGLVICLYNLLPLGIAVKNL